MPRGDGIQASANRPYDLLWPLLIGKPLAPVQPKIADKHLIEDHAIMLGVSILMTLGGGYRPSLVFDPETVELYWYDMIFHTSTSKQNHANPQPDEPVVRRPKTS